MAGVFLQPPSSFLGFFCSSQWFGARSLLAPVSAKVILDDLTGNAAGDEIEVTDGMIASWGIPESMLDCL